MQPSGLGLWRWAAGGQPATGQAACMHNVGGGGQSGGRRENAWRYWRRLARDGADIILGAGYAGGWRLVAREWEDGMRLRRRWIFPGFIFSWARPFYSAVTGREYVPWAIWVCATGYSRRLSAHSNLKKLLYDYLQYSLFYWELCISPPISDCTSDFTHILNFVILLQYFETNHLS